MIKVSVWDCGLHSLWLPCLTRTVNIVYTEEASSQLPFKFIFTFCLTLQTQVCVIHKYWAPQMLTVAPPYHLLLYPIIGGCLEGILWGNLDTYTVLPLPLVTVFLSWQCLFNGFLKVWVDYIHAREIGWGLLFTISNICNGWVIMSEKNPLWHCWMCTAASQSSDEVICSAPR